MKVSPCEPIAQDNSRNGTEMSESAYVEQHLTTFLVSTVSDSPLSGYPPLRALRGYGGRGGGKNTVLVMGGSG